MKTQHFAWLFAVALGPSFWACIPEASLPVAVVGDVPTVKVGQRVDLDASASTDKSKRPLVFAWRMVRSPKGSTSDFSNSRAAAPSFVPDAEGEFVVGVTVGNGLREATEVQKTITVAGSCVRKTGSVTGDEGAPIPIDIRTADGGCENATAEFRWELVARPTGSTATIVSNAMDPGLVPDVDGTYLLRYSVRFASGSFGPPESLSVTVRDCTPVPTITTDELVGSANVLTFLDPPAVELALSVRSPCERAIQQVEWLAQSAPVGVASSVVNAPLLNGAGGSYLTVPSNGVYGVGVRVTDSVGLSSPVVQKRLMVFANGAGLAEQPTALAAALIGSDERLAIAYMSATGGGSEQSVFYSVLNPTTGAFETEVVSRGHGAPTASSIALAHNSTGLPRIVFNDATGIRYAQRSAGGWAATTALLVSASPGLGDVRLHLWTHVGGETMAFGRESVGPFVLQCANNCISGASWSSTVNPGLPGTNDAAQSLTVVNNGTLAGFVWQDSDRLFFRRCSTLSCAAFPIDDAGSTVDVDMPLGFNAPPSATMSGDGRVSVAYVDRDRGVRVSSCSQITSSLRSFVLTANGGNRQIVRTGAVADFTNGALLATSAAGVDHVWWNDVTTQNISSGRASIASRAADAVSFGPARNALINRQTSSSFPASQLVPLVAGVVNSRGVLWVVYRDSTTKVLSLASSSAP